MRALTSICLCLTVFGWPGTYGLAAARSASAQSGDVKEGKTKIEALKLARQAVWVKEPHPYFWSGLILHGEG